MQDQTSLLNWSLVSAFGCYGPPHHLIFLSLGKQSRCLLSLETSTAKPAHLVASAAESTKERNSTNSESSVKPLSLPVPGDPRQILLSGLDEPRPNTKWCPRANSLQTHPPMKQQAGKVWQHISSAAAIPESLSLLVCEGVEAIPQEQLESCFNFSRGCNARRASKHTCTHTLLLTNTSLGRARG